MIRRREEDEEEEEEEVFLLSPFCCCCCCSGFCAERKDGEGRIFVFWRSRKESVFQYFDGGVGGLVAAIKSTSTDAVASVGVGADVLGRVEGKEAEAEAEAESSLSTNSSQARTS